MVMYYFQLGVYMEKYPNRVAGSVSGIIYFCADKKSVSCRQTGHMFITT